MKSLLDILNITFRPVNGRYKAFIRKHDPDLARNAEVPLPLDLDEQNPAFKALISDDNKPMSRNFVVDASKMPRQIKLDDLTIDASFAKSKFTMTDVYRSVVKQAQPLLTQIPKEEHGRLAYYISQTNRFKSMGLLERKNFSAYCFDGDPNEPSSSKSYYSKGKDPMPSMPMSGSPNESSMEIDKIPRGEYAFASILLMHFLAVQKDKHNFSTSDIPKFATATVGFFTDIKETLLRTLDKRIMTLASRINLYEKNVLEATRKEKIGERKALIKSKNDIEAKIQALNANGGEGITEKIQKLRDELSKSTAAIQQIEENLYEVDSAFNAKSKVKEIPHYEAAHKNSKEQAYRYLRYAGMGAITAGFAFFIIGLAVTTAPASTAFCVSFGLLLMGVGGAVTYYAKKIIRYDEPDYGTYRSNEANLAKSAHGEEKKTDVDIDNAVQAGPSVTSLYDNANKDKPLMEGVSDTHRISSSVNNVARM